MAETIKKVTRKVIKKGVSRLNKEEVAPVSVRPESSRKTDQMGEGSVRVKKTCFFCESKTLPLYTDINTLRRFLTERSKIVPKLRSGLCSKHQRRVTIQIKYARHLALLPFTPGV